MLKIASQVQKAKHLYRYHVLTKLEDDKIFTAKIVFSDAANFRLSGHVSGHYVRIWVSNTLPALNEDVTAMPKTKVFVFCLNKIVGVFFSASYNVTSVVHLYKLEKFLMSILKEKSPTDQTTLEKGLRIFTSKFGPCILDRQRPRKLTGSCGPITWPPPSSSFTPNDSF
jgi:hypothetical protein